MENKQKICDLLLLTLQETHNAADTVSFIHDDISKQVTVTFSSVGKRIINVAMDSATAMIRDIMSNLEV